MDPDIQSYLNRSAGLRVADAWRGHYSAIFLELGRLHKHPAKTTHASRGKGDVSLMLDCKWRLETPRTIALGSLDRYSAIERGIAKLIGTTICKVSVLGRIPEIVVEFEEQRWLQSFSDSKSSTWAILYRNQGSIGRKGRKVVYEVGRKPHVVD
jgi:hypothetical protein